AKDGINVQAGLGVRGIDVVSGQQAMALGSDIANLEHHAVAEIALDGEVVLSGVLRAQMRREFTVEKNRAKQRQVSGLAFNGGNNPVERVRRRDVVCIQLTHERSVKEGIGERRTAAERRLCAELGQHQLFDRVVEKTPTGANAGFATAAEQLRQGTAAEVGTVSDADARSKRLVVRRGHSCGDAGVSRDYQAGWFGAGVSAGGIRHTETLPIGGARGDCTRIDGGILSWAEGLDVTANIRRRRGKFPAQAIVQSQVRLELPTVLGEGIDCGAANIFALTGALNIDVCQPEEELGIIVAIGWNDRIGAIVFESIVAIQIEVVVLVEAGAADIDAELEGVIAFYPRQAVGPLKTVPDLGKDAFPIVTELSAAGNVDVRNSRQSRRQPRCNAQLGRGTECTLDVAGVGKSGKAILRCRSGAGGGDGIRGFGLEEPEFALTHVCEVSLVHQGAAECPSMSEVILLEAEVVVVSETWNVGARLLEIIVGLKLTAIIEVVIRGEVLTVANPVIEAGGKLIGVVGTHGDGLILAGAAVRRRNELLKQVRRHWILACGRNDACGEDVSPQYIGGRGDAAEGLDGAGTANSIGGPAVQNLKYLR